MKRLISKIFFAKMLAFFLTLQLFFHLGHVYAYEFEWIGLQTREFASGYVHNVAYFGIIPINTIIDLDKITLTDSNNVSVPYAGTQYKDWRRLLYYAIDGSYNSNTGLFDYGPVTQHLHFSMDFDINPPTPQPLIEGDYTFDIDGDLQTAKVHSVVVLPFVDPDTLKKSYGFNSNYGENVTTLYWGIPSGFDPNIMTFRVECSYSNGPDWVSGLYIYLPTNLNHVVIPDSVLKNEDLPEYTDIDVRINIQEFPYQHRTYPNSVNMDDIPTLPKSVKPNPGLQMLLLND